MEAFTRLGKHKEAVTAGQTALDFEIKFTEELLAKADAEQAAAKDSKNKRDKNAPPPLDKNSPDFKTYLDETQKAMLYYYQNLMNSYQQLNDAPKTIEFAEKALDQDPENLLTLLTLSSVLAERPPAEEKAKEEAMKRAEETGKKALTKVVQLIQSPMAAQMPADQKASLESTAHQTLGLVYINQKKFGDAQKEYTAAVTAKKDDPVSYFRLGLAYAQDKPPKVDEALEALAKAAYLKGVTEAQALDVLKQLYQAKKKSLDGLDQFIKDAGQKISQ
jgi:tetratricopeptide (TPR) repeat protein